MHDLYEKPALLTLSLESIGLHDNALLCLSLVLLLLSTIDSGPLGLIVTSCWFASFLVLTFVNIGGALAVYISSLAIFSTFHFEGWASISQRPDNYAVVILFFAMLILVLNRQQSRQRFPACLVLAFLISSTLHVILLSPKHVSTIFRDFVIPLLACVLSAMIGFRERELKALLNGLAVLGGYTGFVSILERFHGADWTLPPWVGDLSLRPRDQWTEGVIGSGQSGGTLLFPAFNGLLLSLIFVSLFLLMRRGRSWPILVAMFLCAAGAFFTYERGVWLGLALSLLWFPGWCGSSRQANARRVGVVCLAVLFLASAGGMASERLQNSDTVLYRLALWGAGLRLFITHPLLGIGFFNFGDAATSVEQGFGSRLPSFREITDGAASHNTLLTVLVEFGILGFLFYATVFVKIVQRAGNNAARLWKRPGLVWLLGFSIVYLSNAQFISAFEGTTNTVFFGLLGVIAGAQNDTI